MDPTLRADLIRFLELLLARYPAESDAGKWVRNLIPRLKAEPEERQ